MAPMYINGFHACKWPPCLHARPQHHPPPFLATPTALAMEQFLLYSISIRPETAEGCRPRLPWVLLMEFSDHISSGIELAIIRVIPVQVPISIASPFHAVFQSPMVQLSVEDIVYLILFRSLYYNWSRRSRLLSKQWVLGVLPQKARIENIIDPHRRRQPQLI